MSLLLALLGAIGAAALPRGLYVLSTAGVPVTWRLDPATANRTVVATGTKSDILTSAHFCTT